MLMSWAIAGSDDWRDQWLEMPLYVSLDLKRQSFFIRRILIIFTVLLRIKAVYLNLSISSFAW